MLTSKVGKIFNPLSIDHTEWSNTLKQFVGSLLTKCLGVFDQFVGYGFKRFAVFNLVVKEQNKKNCCFLLIETDVATVVTLLFASVLVNQYYKQSLIPNQWESKMLPGVYLVRDFK